MTTFSGSRSRTCLYWLNYSLSCGSQLGCFVDVYVSAVDLGFGFCEYKCIGARAAVGAFATLSSETSSAELSEFRRTFNAPSRSISEGTGAGAGALFGVAGPKPGGG